MTSISKFPISLNILIAQYPIHYFRRVKILVLTSRFPYPLEKGDKLRIFHFARELARQGQDVVLVALAEQSVENIDLQQVTAFCRQVYIFKLSKIAVVSNILSNILRGLKLPFQVAYFFNSRIKTRIEKVIEKEKPDHIFCHLVRMSEYVRDAATPKTLDFMDAFGAGTERRAAISSRFVRPFWRIEARLMRDYERFIFPKFDHSTIISTQDRARLSVENPNAVRVVPNGVDVDFFSLANFKRDTPTFDDIKKYDICFVGNLGYYSNIEALRFLILTVLPVLRQQKQDVKILLAGARPTAEVQHFADGNVEVVGWLDDIRLAYAASRLLVAPLLHGVGQQNKILEAMAMHVPVVTTTRVNNAVGAATEIEILLADTEGSFVVQILRLLESVDFQQVIAENGRVFVGKNYSWQRSAADLAQLFEEKNAE